MTLDAVHTGLQNLSMSPDDVQKIVDILKSRIKPGSPNG
jgi:hypothetical protein